MRTLRGTGRLFILLNFMPYVSNSEPVGQEGSEESMEPLETFCPRRSVSLRVEEEQQRAREV